MKFENQDIIDNYLLGRMSDKDKSDFDKIIAGDDEMREQYEFTDNVLRVTKNRYDKLKAIKSWEDDSTNKKIVLRRRLFIWSSSIAAILIIGLFVGSYMMTNERIEAPNLINNTAVRGGSNYNDIEILLKNNDYETAWEMIESEERQVKSISFGNNKKVSGEKQLYEQMLIDSKTYQLKWLKIQALYGLNRYEEAIMLLEDIRHVDGEYKIPADSLYRTIKNSL